MSKEAQDETGGTTIYDATYSYQDGSLWDFAVELSTMRAIKLSNSDLRWMIAKGMIDHAIEHQAEMILH